MKTVGLDISLTSTGIAVIEDGTVTELYRVQSKGPANATLVDRQKRLHRIRLAVCEATQAADLVAVESPAYSSTTGHMHDRSGLWWMVMDWLLTGADLDSPGFARPVVQVSPAQLKKYATGKGNAAKDFVLAAVIRRYPNADVTGHDEADALVLAAMASRHLGQPLEESLPIPHLETLDKIRWPETEHAT